MNITIILGHPNKKSFCASLAKSYEKGAIKAGHRIRFVNVVDMKFNALKQIKKTEKDVKYAQDSIKWADHIVFVFPTWWSTMPALLKGFIDRVFSPGVMYKYESKFHVKKLLKGKSARIIATMDAPPMIYKIYYGNPIRKNMNSILGFCGIKPIKYSYFGSVKLSDDKKRKDWIKKAELLGLKE